MAVEAGERALERDQQRKQSAVLRAISGEPDAELRSQRLTKGGQQVRVASPYLTVENQPGVADALGMLLRESDASLHASLQPANPLERAIFDFCEQLRCEALVPPELPGARRNIDLAFRAWCQSVRGQRIGENGLGLLVYTVTHMVRARLIEVIFDEEVDAITEITRGNLGALIGHALRDLRASVNDQQRFATATLEISRLVIEMAGDAAVNADAEKTSDAKARLLILAEWDDAELTGEIVGEGAPNTDALDQASEIDGLGGYHVFNPSYDRQCRGEDLYRDDELRTLRADLDEQIKAQSVSAFRLARRLQQLLAVQRDDGWEDNHELGVLDAKRLARVVAMPNNPNMYRQPAQRPICDAAVTFLVDTSGSMKLQRFEATAVLVDTYARALDLAGVAVELLGFTTGAWAGGRPGKEFAASSASGDAGRLNELLHVVYKDASLPWRRQRHSIAAMMKTLHYREGIDGEALIWAYRRLLARPERRKSLIVISDGSPMDSATAKANPENFLGNHLLNVANHIERDRRVQLGAIALDLDVSAFYTNSVQLDLSGTLGLGTYTAVEELLSSR